MFVGLKALVPNASLNDLRAFVLLHELGHMTGVLGPDRDRPDISGAFNEQIAANCFK